MAAGPEARISAGTPEFRKKAFSGAGAIAMVSTFFAIQRSEGRPAGIWRLRPALFFAHVSDVGFFVGDARSELRPRIEAPHSPAGRVVSDELRHDRRVIRGAPRTVVTVHREAAATAPAAPGEPVEPQRAALLRPAQDRIDRGAEQPPQNERLVDAVEPQLQGGGEVRPALPFEAGAAQRIE